MGLFTKGNVPIDQIKQLKEQGMSDNQIIDEFHNLNVQDGGKF